jgi:hypothetical protein
MAEQINKDRLNELLGIKDGQSFDDYMSEATAPVEDAQSVIDQTEKLLQETKDKVDEIDQKFQENFEVIEQTKNEIQASKDQNGSASVRIDNLINVEAAFKSIEDLVDSTKQMISSVYGIISSCDVLDSETVGAAASLIGETRQLISEYTSLYKQRIKFFDNVKMEMMKQEHRKELLQMKYDLDKRKWEDQHPSTPVDATPVPGVPDQTTGVGTMDMLKMLQQLDDEDEVVQDVVQQTSDENEKGN